MLSESITEDFGSGKPSRTGQSNHPKSPIARVIIFDEIFKGSTQKE